MSVNELDPLRDEGLAFFRKLLAAGNSATVRVLPATNHAGDMTFPDVAPEPYHETLRSLRNYAYACTQRCSNRARLRLGATTIDGEVLAGKHTAVIRCQEKG